MCVELPRRRRRCTTLSSHSQSFTNSVVDNEHDDDSASFSVRSSPPVVVITIEDKIHLIQRKINQFLQQMIQMKEEMTSLQDCLLTSNDDSDSNDNNSETTDRKMIRNQIFVLQGKIDFLEQNLHKMMKQMMELREPVSTKIDVEDLDDTHNLSSFFKKKWYAFLGMFHTILFMLLLYRLVGQILFKKNIF